MDYYLDIKMMPDEEVPIYFIRNNVYTKLHKRLCDLTSTNIGISFPEYKVMLGKFLRLHGTKQRLQTIQSEDWLGGLTGYCHVSSIQQIPEQVSYRTVSRIQMNMSSSKLRRLIKRGSIKPDELKHYNTKMLQKGIDNPFLELESTSNGHKHRRYLSFGKLQDNAITGEFDQFGLSKTATVPWFK